MALFQVIDLIEQRWRAAIKVLIEARRFDKRRESDNKRLAAAAG